jgi:hypothetical protein
LLLPAILVTLTLGSPHSTVFGHPLNDGSFLLRNHRSGFAAKVYPEGCGLCSLGTKDRQWGLVGFETKMFGL